MNVIKAAKIAPLRDSTTPPPIAADERGRSAQTFLVDVIARNGSSIRRAIARGRDIYAFTALQTCDHLGILKSEHAKPRSQGET